MALMLKRKERPVRVMPPGTPVVDWDNPLARDLRFLLYPAGPTFIDLVNNKMGVVGAGCTQSGSLAGRGVLMGHLGTGPSYVDALPNVAFGTGDFSVAAFGTFLTPAAAATVWLSNDANQAAGNSQWRIQPNYNGTANSAGAMAFLTVGGGTTTAVGANSLWTDNERACFVGTRAGTALELYKNGISVATNTGTARDVSAAENQRIGCGFSTTTNNAGGVRVLGAGWARKLDAAEVRAWADNPLGLLSRRVRTYFLPATGGGVTQALTGQAAAASAGTLAPSQTIALAGQSVSASAGTVTYSAAAILNLALSGQAANASAGTIAPAHSTAIAGQSAAAQAGTITYTAAGLLTLPLTGQAASATAGTLTPTHAQALAGQAVAAQAGTISYSAGTTLNIALSGQAVTASAGTMSMSVARLLSGSSIVVAAGTMTSSGGVPSLIDVPAVHTIIALAKARTKTGAPRIRSVIGFT